MYDILLQLLFLNYVNTLGLHDFSNGYKILEKVMNQEEFASSASVPVETRWIEQPLDHFDPKEKRLWLMRYFERLDLWKPNGPVYLFIGGEGEARPGFLRGGMVYELANETNGALFMSEHRFYGKSVPFQMHNIENLKYLSAKQAIADLAHLIRRIKMLPIFVNSKVVVVGGSYPGNLAAWLKLHYPDLVDAAIASSAPVMAKKNFYEYLETVSDVYEQYGTPDCHDRIRDIFKRYDMLMKSVQGISQLKTEENICVTSNMSRPENQHLFFYIKAGYFMANTQYGNEEKIKKHCEIIMEPKYNTSNFRKSEIGKWLNELEVYDLYDETEECYDLNFDDVIEEIVTGGSWLTSWAHQKCTEFSYAKTTSSDNQPFSKNIPIETFYKICVQCFGSDHDESHIESAVNMTNAYFGGLRPQVKNVVFVNGQMDPWHRLGILEDISYDAPAVFIPNASHCQDLLPDRNRDPEELREARKYIKHLIKNWIGIEECDKLQSTVTKEV